MKAVVIVAHGGVEGLEVREVPDPPPPAADRVQVRVQAAALNRADILQRLGRYPAPPGVPADIPGLEFAGEVHQVGEDVQAWEKGQRVFGITGGGAQAQYVNVPESALPFTGALRSQPMPLMPLSSDSVIELTQKSKATSVAWLGT